MKVHRKILATITLLAMITYIMVPNIAPVVYAEDETANESTNSETETENNTSNNTTTDTKTTTKKYATQRGYVKVVSTLILRKKASTSSKKVTTLKAGQKVYIISTKTSGWYKVKTMSGKVGYVKKKYIRTKSNKKYKLLATYTTYSKSSPSNRNYNMKKAAKKIMKYTLKKNATFNWAKVVGRCGKAQGYKVANVIISGKVYPGYGGGVCQVATTLYGCSKKLSMKTIERHNHSAKVSYLNADKYEAAVSYGSKNLRFKNTTGKKIVFDIYVSKGRVIVAAYQVL